MSKFYTLTSTKNSLQKGIFASLFLMVLLTTYTTGFAQYKVVRTESFDNVQYFPFGWAGGKISGIDVNNFTERVVAGTNPICGNHTGAGMMRYRSSLMDTAHVGEQYFVSSPKYDLTNNPGTATVSFWMYRDNTRPTQNDSVTLYVNNNPSANASRVKVTGPVSRVSGLAGAWAQYTAIIPAGFANSSVYFVFVFTKGVTRNVFSADIYIDDFAVETYPKQQVLISSTLNYQETADITIGGAANQLIIGLKVICDGAGDSLRLDSITTNATGTTSLADLVALSSKIWYTKGTSSPIINAGNQFREGKTATFLRDSFAQPPTGNFSLENGENYFWCTLSTTVGSIPGDYVDLDFIGLGVSRYGTSINIPNIPLVSSIVGSRQIDVALCGGIIPTLTVGTSWLNGSYTNNDYINRVWLRGEQTVTPAYPYIDNILNTLGPAVAPYFGGNAPFTVQPPSYEQMPPVDVPGPLHPHVTAVLVQGVSYAAPAVGPPPTGNGGLLLQCGTWSSSNYMAAWIDFNKDGDLLDGGEQIIQSGGLAATGWCSAAVNVPAGVTAPTPGVPGPSGINYGNVKMRVREVFAVSNIQPCQSGYTFGEIEDYTVTIIPSCPAGVKLWLGYTNDWNTPSNWCGGVPTINDVALIDEVGYRGGTQIGAPFDPVINSGTVATAKTIRISSTDTLTVNSPTASSLQIADSLTISYNTPAGGGGKMIVKSAFSDTAQVANGNNQANLISPFMGTQKNARMQLLYSKAELLARGMIAGDVVDQFIFHIRQRAATPVVKYANFTIKYAALTSGWVFPVGPPTAWAPNISAYTQVFSDSLRLDLVPILPGGKGVLTINLTTGMVWNGIDDIVVELCFSNNLVSTTGVTGYDAVCQTLTTGVNRVAWVISTATSAPYLGCVLALPPGGSASAYTNQLRPNITFHFKRPYTKFPINITGSAGVTAGRWVNHGIFTAGRSVVTFNNANLNQDIGGANITNFADLTINKAGAIASQGVIMGLNANVDSLLTLTAGYLDLNQRVLTVNNPLTTSITRTSGWVKSENTPTIYGRLAKNIGTTLGSHLFPFGTATGLYIPFIANLTAGDMGVLTASTYPTNNLNMPYGNDGTPANTVIHMRDLATGSDLTVQNVADRLWQLNKTGPLVPLATADLTYTITTAERPTAAGAAPNTLKAQIWESPNGNGNDGWKVFPGLAPAAWSHSDITNSTIMKGITQINGPWVLSNVSQPLPIELLNFDAKLIKDKVKIWWSTASELDNDFFTVERTVDVAEYSFIDKVKSQGNSTQVQNYETYDLSPVVGLQYYRLKVSDIEGNHEYSKLVSVRYSKDGLFSINYMNANYSSNSLDVVFTYDSNESYTYAVVDILGRTLVTKTGNAGYPGVNTLNIPVSMSKGIYFVVIENSQKKVSSKIVY